MDKVCSACGATKDVSHFVSGVNGRIAKMCEACREPRRRSMRKVPKEVRTFRHQQWRYSNGRSKEYMSEYNMRYHNGINQEQFDTMLESQDGVCAICKDSHTEGFEKLCIDHNHTTMQFRGLLCSKCNTALGLFNDDPQRLVEAINYLERTKDAPVICTPIKAQTI